MENDGYTLDAKRNKIEGSDIPDIINRFNHLEDEKKRSRKDKSFMVPVQEIIENNYYLGINKYHIVDTPKKNYEKPIKIYNDIKELEIKFEKKLENLGGLLK